MNHLHIVVNSLPHVACSNEEMYLKHRFFFICMLIVTVLDRQRHQVQGQSIVDSESLSPKPKSESIIS